MVLIIGCDDRATDAWSELEFPFENPSDLVALAAFGIPNWSGSEPHNGIDLIVDEQLSSARVIAPAAGTIRAIRATGNPHSRPPGMLLLTVELRVDSEWMVYLVLEPGGTVETLGGAQRDAVLVRVGQRVNAGDAVADLLVVPGAYPHLHYMLMRRGRAVCAYAHSTEDARRIFEELARSPRSNVPDGNICYGDP